MQEDLFRKKSLDKVKSPDTLDEYIHVSNPGVWLLLVSMIVFFILLGVTMGVFVASFTLQKNRWLAKILPAMVAVAFTTVMYIGEMILLSKNLYRFGYGFFFEGLGKLVLAPIDILVILAAGAITYGICLLLNREEKKAAVKV